MNLKWKVCREIDLVFTSNDSKPLLMRTIGKSFAKIADDANNKGLYINTHAWIDIWNVLGRQNHKLQVTFAYSVSFLPTCSNIVSRKLLKALILCLQIAKPYPSICAKRFCDFLTKITHKMLLLTESELYNVRVVFTYVERCIYFCAKLDIDSHSYSSVLYVTPMQDRINFEFPIDISSFKNEWLHLRNAYV